MTRRRFFAPPPNFNFEQRIVVLGSDEARHLKDVLRLRVGDQAYVFDGAGNEFRCIVERVTRDEARLNIDDRVVAASSESPIALTLAVALLKGEKFDLVVQKATELGVRRVVPVATRHADVQIRDQDDAAKKVSRWQRIAIEASKQSGRAVIPTIDIPIDISVLLTTDSSSLRLMFSERDGKSLTEVAKAGLSPDSVTALVGSEGGWSDEELELASQQSWQVITLGGRILRAETAAIVATTLVQHAFGDVR